MKQYLIYRWFKNELWLIELVRYNPYEFDSMKTGSLYSFTWMEEAGLTREEFNSLQFN